MLDRFIELLREELEKQLASKYGWGRNELMSIFDRACCVALLKYAQEKGLTVV